MIISKCGCFTIETGGVMLATWSAMQMIFAIIFVFALWAVFPYFHEEAHFYAFILLVITIAALCIALLSMRGIDKRNHRLMIPMLILSSVLLILQLVLSYYCLIFIFQPNDDRYEYYPYPRYYRRINSFQKVILVAGIFLANALTVLSVLVFFSLYELFKNEPRSGQNGRICQQQFVPTTQYMESHLENC